jgi:hypothetical protein
MKCVVRCGVVGEEEEEKGNALAGDRDRDG